MGLHVEWSIISTKTPIPILFYWQSDTTCVLKIVGFHLAQIHQNINLSFYFCLLPIGQLFRGYLARWEPLCIHIMLFNGAVAKFTFVPNKNILVTLQHLPQLFLFFIQVRINLDFLTYFLPYCAYLITIRCCQLVARIIMDITTFCFMNL